MIRSALAATGRYAVARLKEGSTWMGFAAAATSAAALSPPFSYVVFAASAIAVLTPHPKDEA